MNSVSATINGSNVNVVEINSDGSNIYVVYIDASGNLNVTKKFFDGTTSATNIGTSAKAN